MKKPITEQDALFRITALCAQSEQCEHALREKMTKWGLTEEACDRIIDQLYDEKYIDEQRFARAYARDKMRYNHWGRQKIDQGMRLMRISSVARRTALDELPEQEYLEILQHILKSKARQVKGETEYERNGKLIRFALGRGFEMNHIYQILSELEKETDDTFYDTDDAYYDPNDTDNDTDAESNEEAEW